ncbi:MAG: hypothetical protein K5657_00490 [Desulfovibrio sp.]|nr:hypothetical protein [Desulfovibrio sp.]
MEIVRLLGILLLVGMLFVEPACAAPGTILIKDGNAFRIEDGRETALKDCPVQKVGTEAGLWSWILVGQNQFDGLGEKEEGIYFFRGKDAAPAGFLPVTEEVESCRLTFSPSGEYFLLSWGMEYVQHLNVYAVGKNKDFVKKTEIPVQGPSFWIDARTFAVTSVDMKKGMRVSGKFDLWWSSIALHDVITGKTNVLRAATETRNYCITGIETKDGSLEVMESVVKGAKDWADDEKVSDTQVRLSRSEMLKGKK